MQRKNHRGTVDQGLVRRSDVLTSEVASTVTNAEDRGHQVGDVSRIRGPDNVELTAHTFTESADTYGDALILKSKRLGTAP